MKNNKMRKPPTAVLIVVIAVIIAVSTAVAWLKVAPAIMNRVYSLSNFDSYANVYFAGSSNEEAYRQGDGSLLVDVNTPAADNYIANLRVDAKYKGRGSFYLRLKMVQQWQDSAGNILQSDAVLPYNISTPYDLNAGDSQNAWFDNRLDDFCLYYAEKLKAANETYTTTPVIIAGFDEDRMAAIAPSGTGVTLRISFSLEAVQINRYPQFWGITTLPWLE